MTRSVKLSQFLLINSFHSKKYLSGHKSTIKVWVTRVGRTWNVHLHKPQTKAGVLSVLYVTLTCSELVYWLLKMPVNSPVSRAKPPESDLFAFLCFTCWSAAPTLTLTFRLDRLQVLNVTSCVRVWSTRTELSAVRMLVGRFDSCSLSDHAHTHTRKHTY